MIEGHPFRDVRAQPAGPTTPEVWILGSSDYGAQVAAHFGLPYCFAHFITDGHGVEQALAAYRGGYRPSARHPVPHAAICVWAMAAETREEAAWLFQSREMWRLGRDRGVYTALPSPGRRRSIHTRMSKRRASNACGSVPCSARLASSPIGCGPWRPSIGSTRSPF